ncbi:hypothetical protein KS4_03570 [Poriferisphaera corsica]|uniref:PEP-CTERM protein-sorting domain-containing protein n=1 Tax=Poriferisphaera corsica TaxID=2528020 RepID=A0A517YQ24_9BACT|nr:hypothetical protein [Poriferisphaera corsica]QDU32325.1 hypothetical protein KS4_03570 [Poriferisphaera corsica]
MKNIKTLTCAIIACVISLLTTNLNAGNITFNDLTPGTTIPVLGPITPSNTQPITTFTSNGYTLRLDHYYNVFNGTFYTTDGATVTAPSFGMSTNSLFLNSTILHIDFAENGIAPPTEVTIDYVEIKPDLSSEDGAIYNASNFPRFLQTNLGAGFKSLGIFSPWNHNGATLTNTIHNTSGNQYTGTLTITPTSPVDQILSLSFGSSNLYIDSITFTEIPEPTSLAFLTLASLTLIRRRHHSQFNLTHK